MEDNIVAYCGTEVSPMGNLHFPYWSGKACDGYGGRMRLSLTVSTLAASIELSLLHSTTTALLSGDVPSCSDFDLSRWGLLEISHAMRDSSAVKPADDVRDRSRSPRRDTGAASGSGKASGKSQAKHGRSGLEPQIIKLLRAWYAKNWTACGSICDSIWWSRENIQKHVK